MASMQAKTGAALCGCLLAMAATMASAANVDAKLKAYQDSSAEATRIMTGITDEASAKANAARLDAAMKKQHADDAALNSELKKLNLGKEADGREMEKATAEMAKTNEALTAQQMRILGNPAAGSVVGRSFGHPVVGKKK